MATSFTKDYSVTVTFTKGNAEDLTDADLNSVKLRADIQKEIAEVCLRSMGTFETRPGSVSEA